MSFFGLITEKRASFATETVISSTATGSEWKAFFGLDGIEVGEITAEMAMSITSVYSAVNFIADQFASLPCHVYRNVPKGGGTVKAEGDPLHAMMTGVVNDNYRTSFEWRKAMAISVLLNGRAFSHIERDGLDREKNFRELVFKDVTPRLTNGRLEFAVRKANGLIDVIPAKDMIDINPNPMMDGVSHYNPVEQNRATLSLMIAAEKFSATTFANNGVPPLQLVSSIASSPGAQERAGNKVFEALRNAAAQKKNILPLPEGYELKPIGFDPAKLQLLELRKWMISETARILRLPKFFLSETDGGTLANVEHQSQSLVKNTLTPMLIAPFEGQMTAKCGKRNTFVKLNLNGFLRGDFKTQMEGLQSAVNAGIMTANEARELLELAADPKGDALLVNGTMVPIGDAGKHLNQPAPATNTTKEEPVAEPVGEDQ